MATRFLGIQLLAFAADFLAGDRLGRNCRGVPSNGSPEFAARQTPQSDSGRVVWWLPWDRVFRVSRISS
ncbi:hypothetical protein D9M69_578170 [compost metagenome]